MIKTCEYCGVEFEAKRKDKRFCSDSCRNAAWTDVNRKPQTVATDYNASRDDLILAELRALRDENADLKIQLAQTKEDLGTQIQSVKRSVSNIQVTTVTTTQTNIAPPRQSDDDLGDLLQEVELTEEQRAERGRQATQNFLSSLTAMAASSKGPRKMETPPLAAPGFDDIEL